MPIPFHTTRRVEFADTDMAGIVHFANFFRYMEAAEVEFLRSLGLSVRLVSEGLPLSFPRVAAACDYLRPARFEDVLDVKVTLERVGRKSVTYAFEFAREGDMIARGKVSSVCCRVQEGRQLESVDIPEAIRRRLEPTSANPDD
jgi:YbgC/YbaW family acyl-CoA thioester hydrolase